MKNKINTKRNNRQIDKMLEEEYTAETRILESALLKAAGKTSWEEFPEESEEKIQEGYNRLIARLKEKGEYTEAMTGNETWNINEASGPESTEKVIKTVKEKLRRMDGEWKKIHRILKPSAVGVTMLMLTMLAGMTVVIGF